jgi:hypothetical protein
MKKIYLNKYFFIFFIGSLIFTSTIFKVIADEKDNIMLADVQEFEITKWYKYEPVVVTLKGTVILLNDYGPPNYGENPKTDQKVRYYVLELDKPINVKADPKSDVNTNSFLNECLLQLVILSDNIEVLRDKLNKKVMVKGTLYQGFTGHHYTNVLIKVNKIELAEEKVK